MTLTPVNAVEAFVANAGRGTGAGKSRDSLFDLIHSGERSPHSRDQQQGADLQEGEGVAAAAAVQLLALQVSYDVGADTVGQDADGAPLVPNLPSVPASQALRQAVEAATQPDAPAQAAFHARNTDPATPVARPAHDSGLAVRQGTLPVLVAGQLVELALLKERRSTREPGTTRRISMVLEGDAAGTVSVEARIQDDCLIVALDGSASRDPGAQEHYTREVQDLTRRLGWQFVDTRLEIFR